MENHVLLTSLISFLNNSQKAIQVSVRVNEPSLYQLLKLNHSLHLNNAKIARNNESLKYNFND